MKVWINRLGMYSSSSYCFPHHFLSNAGTFTSLSFSPNLPPCTLYHSTTLPTAHHTPYSLLCSPARPR